MPRRRDTPCTKCGKLTWWNSKTSKPKDEIVCHSCMRATSTARQPGRTVPVEEQLRRMHAAKAAAIRNAVCASCPAEFTTTAPNRRYCGTCAAGRISDRHRKKNRSRLGYQKSIRSFPLTALGDRDGWMCWLCDLPVDKALKSRHPMMASYDHVIPTSKGGSDEPDNLRLAHLRCNVARGNRDTSAIVKA